MNGINVLLRDPKETLNSVHHMEQGYSKKTVFVNQKVASEIEKPAGGLALDSPTSGTVRNTFLVHKVTQSVAKIPAAQEDEDTRSDLLEVMSRHCWSYHL